MNNKSIKVLGWIIAGVVALALLGTGLLKLSGGSQAAEMAEGVGGRGNLIILGSMEILIAILWLLPRVGLLGGLLAMAYMGGAMAVHFINNQPLIIPLVIQVLIWLGVALRFHETTRRLRNQVVQ